MVTVNNGCISSVYAGVADSKRQNEKPEISSFKKYRVLKKVICKYF